MLPLAPNKPLLNLFFLLSDMDAPPPLLTKAHAGEYLEEFD